MKPDLPGIQKVARLVLQSNLRIKKAQELVESEPGKRLESNICVLETRGAHWLVSEYRNAFIAKRRFVRPFRSFNHATPCFELRS